MLDNQRSFYAIIPANVRYDNSLNANAKLLYGEITALCNEKGYCWATNEYFANLYGVSEKTITRWISDLKEKNYILTKIETFRYNDGTVKKVRYIFIDENSFNNSNFNNKNKEDNVPDHMDKIVPDHMDNFVSDHTDKNVPYNNTLNNNTINNILSKKEETPKQAAEKNDDDKKSGYKVELTFDEIIEKYSDNENIQKLLKEWLKIRKVKRMTLTNGIIYENLKKIDKLSKDSNMSVEEYLQEAISKGWGNFYKIEKTNNKTKESSRKELVPDWIDNQQKEFTPADPESVARIKAMIENI